MIMPNVLQRFPLASAQQNIAMLIINSASSSVTPTTSTTTA